RHVSRRGNRAPEAGPGWPLAALAPTGARDARLERGLSENRGQSPISRKSGSEPYFRKLRVAGNRALTPIFCPDFRGIMVAEEGGPMKHALIAAALAVAPLAVTPILAWSQASPHAAEIDKLADGVEKKVIAWRRDIYQNPELGNQEHRTAKLVA